jgi:plastocyanin
MIMVGPVEGTVHGKVTFQGKSRLPGMKLSDVVVSIEDFAYSNPSASGKDLAATNGAVLSQKDLTFTPHVLPVVAGTEVSFRNDDKVFHNLHSKSPAYPFNFGQFKSNKAVRKVKFDKPGIVPIDCDVHSEMHAFILVKPNPYFALADEKGLFSLQHLSAGKYKIQAWHEKFEPVVKEITVTEGQATTVELNLEKKK